MRWYNDQQQLLDRAKRAHGSSVQNSVEIPLDWLIASAQKLQAAGAKVMHIIVTDENRQGTLVHGKKCAVNIEGYEPLTATKATTTTTLSAPATSVQLGNQIGVCEQFPPIQWP